MESLDELALVNIARFLHPEDIVRLGRTCKRLHSVLPRFELVEEEWLGEEFHISGPHHGHFSPELYFDAPALSSTVMKLSMSVTWLDQGWGNRKGELFLVLMRPNADGLAEKVAEYRGLFGIAEHKEETRETVINKQHPVVNEAKPGDFYRFMRNAGGGGGHRLIVTEFRAVAYLFRIIN
ncbi:PREDICTED: uncharacterized protein LOC107339115 [Acropora digitifera]|uniref:uncharacterized protein LOC107339115 n=1 Tax=Acropora digitifera TaxID=70779 RepID=UPI00077AE364|nr:PREDICTED: uncharacterized protein LOC107339115 [Acropora digitifera]